MSFIARFRLAVEVLRGRVTIKNETAVCAKEHVEAGQVRVKKSEHDALLAGNTELGVLRGAVATLDGSKFLQVRHMVNETITNVQKGE